MMFTQAMIFVDFFSLVFQKALLDLQMQKNKRSSTSMSALSFLLPILCLHLISMQTQQKCK